MKLKIFYKPEMVVEKLDQTISKSPLKPKLVTEQLLAITNVCQIESNFEPFTIEDFFLAHNPKYVKEFFFEHKQDEMTWADLQWSPELAESVKYTNSSLYHAIKWSVKHPNDVTLSPVAGFHHATYHRGMGFCTFAGQVIASIKLYREQGLKGCYLDLDQHQGNSIEDIRPYVRDLNLAVPKWANFNPIGNNEEYVESLINFLNNTLKQKIANGECDYLVWCHGADSHYWDDFSGSVTTEEWINCSKIFFEWLKGTRKELNKPIPLTLCLFGGYRQHSYQSVINLHLADNIEAMNVLLDANIAYELVETEEKHINLILKE